MPTHTFASVRSGFRASLKTNSCLRAASLAALCLFGGCQKQQEASPVPPAGATPSAHAAEAKDTLAAATVPTVADAGLRVKAKLVEIPGSFPANDLYNYAYVMRYEIVGVLSGQYADKDILIGHYNPRFARAEIKDEQDSLVDGNVTGFTEGDVQELTLKPMDAVYTGAIEDEFFQDKRPRWFALRADKGTP